MLYTPTSCCIVLVITVLEEFLHALYTHLLLYSFGDYCIGGVSSCFIHPLVVV